MKTILLFALGMLLLGGRGVLFAQAAVVAEQPVRPATFYPHSERVPGGGIMTFEEESHDFGELMQGGDASWKFRFTNTGTSDISIEAVKGSGNSCPVFPKEPIHPGEVAEIKILYNTRNVGRFEKSFVIVTNASELDKRLYIKGTIVPKPADPAYLVPIQDNSPTEN